MRITYLGHSAVKIETNGEVILIDPFLIASREYDYKSDNIKNILITHAHNDHTGSAVEISKIHNAPIVGVFELANHLASKGAQAIGANLGGWLNFSWGRIKLCPALHSSSFADGTTGGVAVGFLMEIEGKLVYHAGDSGLTQEFKTIPEFGKVDLAFMPIGGFYTMDTDEAIIGAKWLEAKAICPIHYNTFDAIKADINEFHNCPSLFNILDLFSDFFEFTFNVNNNVSN